MLSLKSKLRDPQVWGFFLSMAVMAVISIAFFYPDNFEGNTLSQPDMMQGAANSHESALYEQQTGEKALWTNALFSGMPTFQISPSYPSNKLFSWINTLYGMGLPAPSNLLFMMMLGFLIMMYCMGQRWYYGLLGAVAWAFSTYFIIIIGAGHIWKFVTLSYIPPTIGGLVLCYRRRYLLGGALTALFAMMQLSSNHPQMSYYFTFVMVAFAIVYLVEAVRRKQLKEWVLASGILVLAAALAFGANLPSIYNSYAYAKETQRAQSELTQVAVDGPAERPTGGMPKSQIVGWSYGGSEMFSLLVPNIKGGANAKPVGGRMQHLGVDQLDGASAADPTDAQLLPYFSQYFNDSEGTNGPVYVGALICALFLMGCFIVRGPVKWALLALTVLSCLLALGRNFESLTDFMIYNFPMYSKFRAVESILVIAEFTMPLLAVLALVQFIRDFGEASGKKADRPSETTAVKVLYGAFGVCVLICLAAAMSPGIFGPAVTSQDRELFRQIYEQYGYNTMQLQSTVESLRYGMVRDDALRSLLILLLGFGVLWLYSRRHLGKYIAIAAIGALVLFDLYGVDKRYVSDESFVPVSPLAVDNPIVFTPDEVDNQILADKDPHFRVMDFAGFGDARRSYFHKMIGGYHSAKLGRYNDLITTGRINSQNVLDMLNARYFIGADRQGRVFCQRNPYALGNAWLVDSIDYVRDADAEIAALDGLDPATRAVADEKFIEVLGKDVVAPVPGDTIYLTSYTPNTLKYHVDTRSGGIGVFSEVWFPWGWKATIDGTPAPLARVNYVLRAMRLPAGSHEVVMTFDPDSIHSTETVAYISIALIYLLLLAALLRTWLVKSEE